MSSKHAKRRHQGQPPPRSRSQAAAAQREASPRVLIAAAVVLAILIVAGFAAFKLTSGSDAKPPPPGVALPGAADVERMLKGIPQSGNVLGSPAAPATLVEYVDLQCPYCQQFETQVMPNVIDKYVRTGKLKVDIRVLAFIGPDSQRGQSAAIAAGAQGKEFNFAQLLYANQSGENTGWLSDDMVSAAAASIPGLDVEQLQSDRDSSAVTAAAKRYVSQATADRVTGTPTLLVGPTGSTLKTVSLQSPTDEQTLTDAIGAALG